MIAFLVELVASWFAGSRAHAAAVASMHDERARAYTAGEDVFFPGSVVGDVSYATPAGGSWLVVSGNDLAWSGAKGYERGLWTPIPVARLDVRRERTPRRDFEGRVPRDWRVFECQDGTAPVLIACDPADARYLRIVLGLAAE